MNRADLPDRPFGPVAVHDELAALRDRLVLAGEKIRAMRRACASVVELLDQTPGATLQERWTTVEEAHWAEWEAGRGRLAPAKRWTWGPAALVLSRALRPGWEVLSRGRLSQWIAWLPENDPLHVQMLWLRERIARIGWANEEIRRRGHLLGVRIMLRHGYSSAAQITDADLREVPDRVSCGMDALDAVLCDAGVLARSPQRGSQRRLRRRRLTPAELVAGSQVPERFREVHRVYLEAYQQRISDVYATTRHKHNSLEKLWAFLEAEHPDVGSSAQVRRSHMLAFVGHAIERAREVQRRQPRLADGEDRLTAHQWLVNSAASLPTSAAGPARTAHRSPAGRHRRCRWNATTSSASALRRRAGGRPSAKRPRSSTSSARFRSFARWPRVAGRTPPRSWTRRRRIWRLSAPRWTASGTGRCWSCCCNRGCESRRPAS
jgi:hypothetical protein